VLFITIVFTVREFAWVPGEQFLDQITEAFPSGFIAATGQTPDIGAEENQDIEKLLEVVFPTVLTARLDEGENDWISTSKRAGAPPTSTSYPTSILTRNPTLSISSSSKEQDVLSSSKKGNVFMAGKPPLNSGPSLTNGKTEEDWPPFLDRRPNTRDLPFLDEQKVKQLVAGRHKEHQDGGNNKDTFGKYPLANVTNSSHLWGPDSPLWSRMVSFFKYGMSQNQKLLNMINRGLSAYHIPLLGWCKEAKVFVDLWLQGHTLDAFLWGECLPDFQLRLKLLISVVHSIVDLNRIGYVSKDWKVFQWVTDGDDDTETNLYLVDLEGSVVRQPKDRETPIVVCSKGFYHQCPPKDIITQVLLKHPPDSNTSSSWPLLHTVNGKPEIIDQEPSCDDYLDFFWSPFMEIFNVSNQYTNNFYHWQASRLWTYIRLFLRPKGTLWSLPDDMDKELQGIMDWTCDVITPPSTLELLDSLLEFERKWTPWLVQNRSEVHLESKCKTVSQRHNCKQARDYKHMERAELEAIKHRKERLAKRHRQDAIKLAKQQEEYSKLGLTKLG